MVLLAEDETRPAVQFIVLTVFCSRTKMFAPFFNSQGPVVKKATLPATYYTTSVFPKILSRILLQVKK